MIEVHRAIPALKAGPTDLLIVRDDGTTEVLHREWTHRQALARALATGAATLVTNDDPPPASQPHRLHLVEG